MFEDAPLFELKLSAPPTILGNLWQLVLPQGIALVWITLSREAFGCLLLNLIQLAIIVARQNPPEGSAAKSCSRCSRAGWKQEAEERRNKKEEIEMTYIFRWGFLQQAAPGQPSGHKEDQSAIRSASWAIEHCASQPCAVQGVSQ